MGFGFGGGCNFNNRCHEREEEYRPQHNNNNNSELLPFLRTIAPGTCIVIQYACQKPTSATFQGFQGNNVIILSDFDCFPGLARIAINKINALSVNSPDCSNFCCKDKYCRGCEHDLLDDLEI